MKELILNLKKDRLVYLFAVLGLILIAAPAKVEYALPYILGVGCLVYSIVETYACFKYPDSEVLLGECVIKGVIGVILLFLKADAISVIGTIWAMYTLHKVSEEINDFQKTKEISVLSVVSIIISLVLAALLLIDPLGHFGTHVRLLGCEILVSVFVRRKKRTKYVDEDAFVGNNR